MINRVQSYTIGGCSCTGCEEQPTQVMFLADGARLRP